MKTTAKTSAHGRGLRASSLVFALSAAALLIASLVTSAFAATNIVRGAADCAIAERDATIDRADALLGAKYLAVLDGFIAAGKSACASGDFAAANAAYDQVRGMASSE